MSAEASGRERRFVDTNLFVYAHDESAGHKRKVPRGLTTGLWERALDDWHGHFSFFA